MALPKSSSDFFAGRSKRSLIVAAIIVATIAVALYAAMQIRPMATSQIETVLKGAGFRDVRIGNLSLFPTGLHATDITLDQYGFDKIDSLSAGLNWPAFLTSGKISNLEVRGVTLTRTADGFSSSARQLANNLLNLPDYRIALSGVTLDLDTGFGAIRMTIDATAEPAKDAGTHNVQANIKADQYQLGFQSMWQGTLVKGGKLDLAGNVLDGRLNLGPLRISRFNGWIGTTIESSGYTLQSQIEAGSASFMNVPLSKVSVVNDSNNAKDDVMVRSGISGIPDILFTADMTRSDKEQSFIAALKGKNLGGFLDYIDEATKADKQIAENLLAMREFELVGTFQPEKRFVGGPMPFGLTLIADDNKILDGNVLFYPDTFEVRGSLEAKADTAQALQDYFKIPSANIVQNFIRLDGDARKFFGFEVKEPLVDPANGIIE